MENNELKKGNIKNRKCYYFNDITKFEDFHFGNTLLDEKSCENILISANSLCILFDKVDGFVRDYDGTKYLVLFGLEKYDFIYVMISFIL